MFGLGRKAAREEADEVAEAQQAADRAEDAAIEAEESAAEAENVAESDFLHEGGSDDLGQMGRPFNHRSPFLFGLMAGAGALLAIWLGQRILQIGPVLVLVVIAVFISVGLNPLVEMLMRRGMKRAWAVLIVAIGMLLVLTGFVFTIAPIVSNQVTTITDNAPGWLDQLQSNRWAQDLDRKYDVIAKAQQAIEDGHWAQKAAGGAVGFGLKLLSFLGNTFVVLVLTLYFLATLPQMKRGLYQLAPASRRARVQTLGDRILKNIGGYVSGAFIVALCAGVSTLIFLFAIGLGEFAVALALVVALLDVIPMIGATIGAVIVCAIGFATDVRTGVACVIFFLIYQQVENYVVYPKVMSKSVDIPGAVTVIAALIGASLMGVVGALLAIPTAASILLLVREVFVPRQNQR